MKIKDIKTLYANYEGYKNCRFVVADFGGDISKAIIVVSVERVGGEIWRDVVQVVRISDGKELLSHGRCRPCDNLQNDAYDVASEMIASED